ncbi:acylphosphatase [Strigomonas culicis]|uniref:acylphosphatase n=1 Tax=Strigomonas culicis TaxID=28005 RepID=S9UY19_9TRYP|nr:acylphosphatase [Strigomonas culicis]|eukprot:EPY15440.1 acylphosphatase [Strigomonas culicis]
MSAPKDARAGGTEAVLVMRHMFVSGKVQGVFYRKHTQRAAVQYGVTGWVRNTADGRVEIMAEGTPEQVDKLEMWCHTGSPKSMVKAVVREKVAAEQPLVMRRFDVFSVVK